MFNYFIKVWKDERGFAVVMHGSSLPDSSQKTDFYGIVDNATVTNIVSADISSSAGIMDSQLNTISTAGKVNTSALTGQIANANLAQIVTPALVSGAALTLLPNVPSGAGLLPANNVGRLIGAKVSRTFGQIYQAATDGIVVAISINTSNGPSVRAVSDSSSSPTTSIGGNNNGSSDTASCCFPVSANNYYECTQGSNTSSGLYFFPLGS